MANQAVALDHILVRQRRRTSFQEFSTFKKAPIAAAPKSTCHFLVGTLLTWRIGNDEKPYNIFRFDRTKRADQADNIKIIIKEQRLEASGNGSKRQIFADSMLHALNETLKKAETIRHKPRIAKETLELVQPKGGRYRAIRSQEKYVAYHSKKVQGEMPAEKTFIFFFD